MSGFVSGFAADIEAMLDYREALGFSRRAYAATLANFDRYAMANYPGDVFLSRDIVTGWINEQLEKSKCGLASKTTAIRLFGKYLSAIGEESYILPNEYVLQPPSIFTPYIFTDDEMTRLFHATDRLPANHFDPLVSSIPPVLFRLIYTCGLRPNEGRELLRDNIDFKTGEILITKKNVLSLCRTIC